jgi:hypothetical protein
MKSERVKKSQTLKKQIDPSPKETKEDVATSWQNERSFLYVNKYLQY